MALSSSAKLKPFCRRSYKGAERLRAVRREASLTINGERCTFYCPSALMWNVITLSIICICCYPFAAFGQVTDITILDLHTSANFPLPNNTRAYIAGLKSVMFSRNSTVAGGVKVTFIENPVLDSDVGTVIENAARDSKLLLVMGPATDTGLINGLASLQRNNLIAFGPLTRSLSLRKWNPNYYFIQATPAAGLIALVRYAVTYLRSTRIAFMYLDGAILGDEEYKLCVALLGNMGYKLSGLFRVKETPMLTEDSDAFKSEWEAFVQGRPQAVLMYGRGTPNSLLFLRKLLTDPRMNKVCLLAPLFAQNFVAAQWSAVEAAGGKIQIERVITTSTNPLAKETRYEAVKAFQSVMQDYLKNGQTVFAEDHFLQNDLHGSMMVSGWITGEILVQALGSSIWLTRETFAAEIFNQRRYLVHDIVVGDFAGECSSRAAAQGAACFCNQGGRSITLMTMTSPTTLELDPKGGLMYPLYKCSADAILLLSPVNILTMEIAHLDREEHTGNLVYTLTQRALPGPRVLRHDYTIKLIDANADNAVDVLEKEGSDYITDVYFGLMTPSMLKYKDAFFLDPFFLFPTLATFNRTVMYLSPTMQQQLFVISSYLKGDSVNAVVRVSGGEAIKEVLRRSMVTFGGSLGTVVFQNLSDSLAGILPTSGDTIIIGVKEKDVSAIEAHLTNNPKARLIVMYSDFAELYLAFLNAFDGKPSAQRLIFATNLPHWDDPDSSSPLVNDYWSVFTNTSERTPLSLQMYIASRFIQEVCENMDNITEQEIANYIFAHVVITIGDMTFGPFSDFDVLTCPDVGVDVVDAASYCAVNFGAASVAVWSLNRVFDSTTPLLQNGVDLTIRYIEPVHSGLTKQQLIGIIVGSVIGFILIVTLVALLMYCCRDTRDNKDAPKVTEDPVTLIFTDIESSTSLWATCPEIMPDAVATHHRIIRSLIAKYKCYEVKTIGDSFMIACKDASAAVQLVGDETGEGVQRLPRGWRD